MPNRKLQVHDEYRYLWASQVFGFQHNVSVLCCVDEPGFRVLRSLPTT